MDDFSIQLINVFNKEIIDISGENDILLLNLKKNQLLVIQLCLASSIAHWRKEEARREKLYYALIQNRNM